MFLSSSLSLVDITLLRRDGVALLLFPGDDIQFRMSCCLSPIVFEYVIGVFAKSFNAVVMYLENCTQVPNAETHVHNSWAVARVIVVRFFKNLQLFFEEHHVSSTVFEEPSSSLLSTVRALQVLAVTWRVVGCDLPAVTSLFSTPVMSSCHKIWCLCCQQPQCLPFIKSSGYVQNTSSCQDRSVR